MQTRIPWVVMRGGTSRGPFFHTTDLPADAPVGASFAGYAGLDDPVIRWLPDFQPKLDGQVPTITLRQLPGRRHHLRQQDGEEELPEQTAHGYSLISW